MEKFEDVLFEEDEIDVMTHDELEQASKFKITGQKIINGKASAIEIASYKIAVEEMKKLKAKLQQRVQAQNEESGMGK